VDVSIIELAADSTTLELVAEVTVVTVVISELAADVRGVVVIVAESIASLVISTVVRVDTVVASVEEEELRGSELGIVLATVATVAGDPDRVDAVD
jgi:hypothetical protein